MDREPDRVGVLGDEGRGRRLSRRGALGQIGGVGVAGVAALAGSAPAVAQAVVAQPAGAQEEGNGTGGRSGAGGDAGEAAAAAEELVVPSATRATLPAAGTGPAGGLWRLTDDDRNLWLDGGVGWRSVGGYVFDVRAFGAVGDGATDDWGAFSAAIEAMGSPLDPDSTSAVGRTLLVPPGRYRLGQALTLTRAVRLVGAVGSGPVGDAVLAPDPGVSAIVVEGADPPRRGQPGRRGAGAAIERLRIEGGAAPAAADAAAESVHGVLVRARATLRDCLIVDFGGDGIHVAGGGEAGEEADRWQVDGCQVARCGGHGLRVRGGSAGVCAGLLVVDNRKWGISEESERGNSYLHCHAAGNGHGAFQSEADNTSLFAGCAADAGQGRSQFGTETVVVGGDHAAGYEGGNAWVAAESRLLLRAQAPSVDDAGPLPTVPTLRLAGVAGQSAGHLRIDDEAGERLVEVDAAGRLLVGAAPPTPPVAGPDAVGLAPVLVQIGHPESGRAGIRWVVGDGEAGPGWVAQARALVDAGGDGGGDAGPALSRLTFQTPDAVGGERDTLTLRQGRVGIGTSAPAGSALLELAATGQGFLPPRLTTEERDAIAAPAEGLTVYNRTTRRLNFHDGEGWQEVAVAAASGG